MHTNHRRKNFPISYRNVWRKGTTKEYQYFLKKFWKKHRQLEKQAIKENKVDPLYKGDEYLMLK